MGKKINKEQLEKVNGGDGSSDCFIPGYQIVSGPEGYDSVHYLKECNSKETAKNNAIDYATKMLNKCKSYVFVNWFVYYKTNGKMIEVEKGTINRK